MLEVIIMEVQNQNYMQVLGNYGWICPICGRVYSPNQPECYNCNKKENSVTATSTTIAMSDYEKAVREQYGGEISFGKDGKK